MKRDAPMDLKWGAYGGKLALAVFWIVGVKACADGMFDPDVPGAVRLLFGVAAVVPPIAWALAVHLRLQKIDEFEQRLEIAGLLRGAAFALLFGVLLPAAYLVAEVAGLRAPGSALDQAPLAVTLPPLAWIMGETFVQFERRRLARS